MVNDAKSLDCRPSVMEKGKTAPDMEEFSRLIMEYENLMYNISRSMLRSDADCRDVIQDAVLAAWQGLGRLKEPRYFKTWLVRILINQCNTQLRKKKFNADNMQPDVSVSEPDNDILAVRRAVGSLPRKLQPVVVLYYYEDFSTEEIARALGIARGTVKSRLAKARNDIRRILE